MVKKEKLTTIVFYFFVSFLSLTVPAKAQQADAGVDPVIKRLQTLLASNPPQESAVRAMMTAMQPDGSWKDVDYQNTRISHWPALNHLSGYVLPMAKAYNNPQSPLYQNKQLDAAIHKALDFWLLHNFTSQNWWSNDIGVPNTLTDILVLMNKEISEDEFLRALNQMRGSGIDQTGQNKVWRAEIQLKIGLLSIGRGRTNILGSAKERIRQAVNILQEEVVVKTEEGIQADWSFHQHGVQQQFGNYGLAFASTQSQWAFVLQNSPYQYSKEKIAILRNYILNGLSRVVWNGIMDISGIGRQVFPGSRLSKGASVLHVLQLMAEADPQHASAYEQVIKSNAGEAAQPSFLKGNTYFWRSDLLVDRSAKAYISVRMCSEKIQGTESINGENLLGAYLSDGATFIYQTGKEYEGLFPVWNWHTIPGITSYTNRDLPAFGFQGLHNESNFVGGLADSSFGEAVMLFKRDGLTAHKAWFFVPWGVVCLGAGITGNDNAEVSTTLNQSLLNGSVIVKTTKGEKTISHDKVLTDQTIKWVYHDKTAYLFLQKQRVHVSADNQQGNWKRVYVDGSAKPVNKEVFNLRVDHGAHPQQASYAYMIMPAVSKKALTHFAKHSPLRILRNDTIAQAIQLPGEALTEAVFYRAGKVAANKKTILQSSAPCLLMAQLIGRQLKLRLSAPPQLEKKVMISLKGNYGCESCRYDADNDQTNIQFHLPEGVDAGKSVTQLLNIQ